MLRGLLAVFGEVTIFLHADLIELMLLFTSLFIEELGDFCDPRVFFLRKFAAYSTDSFVSPFIQFKYSNYGYVDCDLLFKKSNYMVRIHNVIFVNKYL